MFLKHLRISTRFSSVSFVICFVIGEDQKLMSFFKKSNPPSITLVYFESCPHAKKAKLALEEAKIPYREVPQDSLPPGSPYENYASPTILLNGEILFGCKTEGSRGCSLDVPTADALLKKLKDADKEA